MENKNNTLLEHYKLAIRRFKKDWENKFIKHSKPSLIIILPATVIRNVFTFLIGGLFAVPISHLICEVLFPNKFSATEEDSSNE